MAIVVILIIVTVLYFFSEDPRDKQRRLSRENESLRQKAVARRDAMSNSPAAIAERERRSREYAEAELKRDEAAKETARKDWREYYLMPTIGQVEAMSGREFEEFVAKLFLKMGYSDVCLTEINDQGGDVIVARPGLPKTVVQTKRWNRPVGNKAVQEVISAMVYYECDSGIVITTSSFTQAARTLAKKAKVVLWDGHFLKDLILSHFTAEIPDFDDVIYRETVEPQLRAVRMERAQQQRPKYRKRKWRRRY